jgi:hypothetical protein
LVGRGWTCAQLSGWLNMLAVWVTLLTAVAEDWQKETTWSRKDRHCPWSQISVHACLAPCFWGRSEAAHQGGGSMCRRLLTLWPTEQGQGKLEHPGHALVTHFQLCPPPDVPRTSQNSATSWGWAAGRTLHIQGLRVGVWPGSWLPCWAEWPEFLGCWPHWALLELLPPLCKADLAYFKPLFFFFFGCTGAWTQGFTLAKQVLHHLSHTSSPFCSDISGDGESLELFALIVLKPDPQDLSLTRN